MELMSSKAPKNKSTADIVPAISFAYGNPHIPATATYNVAAAGRSICATHFNKS